ncbi:MAG TPA: DUF3267 domain-containing protein [Bacteroidota bacterium]
MKPTRALPDSHTRNWGIDLSRDHTSALLLNVAGLPLFLVCGWAFMSVAKVLRPEIMTGLLRGWLSIHPLTFVLVLAGIVVGVMTFHEAIHGIFFWIFTRSKPIFGVKLLFAYAGAPDWYIPRNQYILIGLAPILLMTLLGFLLIVVTSTHVGQAVLFGIVMNATGAAGDLYVCGKVMAHDPDILVQDTGVGVTVFGRVPSPAL